MARGPTTPAGRAEALLQRHWWRPRPSALSTLLRPLSAVYAALAAWQRRRTRPRRAPVPVIVVGNLITGGAGKTPVVIALVRSLQAAGRRPGVISRGYGRRIAAGDEIHQVAVDDDPAVSGDEPLLIARRSGVPVVVAGDRVAAAFALCAAHPAVDVIVADDGLQHHALARDAELVVFDDRGAGNGLLLPAGPLREPLPDRLPPRRLVIYTGDGASTPLPGAIAVKGLGAAWPLAAWSAGDASATQPLSALRGRPLLAAAGIAAPEKFFGMLEAAGLSITRLPLPDHHDYATLPWPAATADVVVTEKDAVKIDRADIGSDGAARVWVVPLDLTLPETLASELIASIPTQPAPPPP